MVHVRISNYTNHFKKILLSNYCTNVVYFYIDIEGSDVNLPGLSDTADQSCGSKFLDFLLF